MYQPRSNSPTISISILLSCITKNPAGRCALRNYFPAGFVYPVLLSAIARLERQVVRSRRSEVGHRRRGGCGRSSIALRHILGGAVGCGSSVGGSLRCGSSHVGVFGFPSTDFDIPAAIVFAAVDVETDFYYLTYLKGILVNAVTEKVEENLTGICLLSFKHIFALLPSVAFLGGAPTSGRATMILPVTSMMGY